MWIVPPGQWGVGGGTNSLTLRVQHRGGPLTPGPLRCDPDAAYRFEEIVVTSFFASFMSILRWYYLTVACQFEEILCHVNHPSFFRLSVAC